MIQPGIVVIVVALAIAVVGGGGSSTNEGCTSSVPGFPLEVIQEQLRKASGSQAGTSSKVPPLVLWTRRRSLYIAVQKIFLPRQMNKGSTTFGHDTRSRTSLTLGCPSVENGAATLTSK